MSPREFSVFFVFVFLSDKGFVKLSASSGSKTYHVSWLPSGKAFELSGLTCDRNTDHNQTFYQNKPPRRFLTEFMCLNSRGNHKHAVIQSGENFTINYRFSRRNRTHSSAGH